MQCPRCQQENPPQAKFCLECGTPNGQNIRTCLSVGVYLLISKTSVHPKGIQRITDHSD